MKKIRILLSVVLVLGLLFTGCKNETKDTSGDAGAGKEVVKIAYSKGSLCVAPVHIAYLNGYFDEEFNAAGLEYEMAEVDLTLIADLIASEKINAGFGLTASLMQPIENGLPIAFTSGIHTGCTKYYVAGDSDINSPADLKGKKIGVPGLADSSVENLKRKLNDLGIGVSTNNMEVEFIAYDMNDLPTALNNGAVDVIGIHDPVATISQNEFGFKKILDTTTDEKFVNEYCCQSYVTTDLAKNNPEGAAAYTRAIQKAAAFIEANPAEAAKIQLENKYVSGELELNTTLLDSYNYTPSVTKGINTFKQSAIELQTFGDLKKDTDLDSFLETSYVKLEGVPDSVTYDVDSKTFTEVN